MERLLKELQKSMYTNNKGVSYYELFERAVKIGKKYYCNSGWLEREITKEEEGWKDKDGK